MASTTTGPDTSVLPTPTSLDKTNTPGLAEDNEAMIAATEFVIHITTRRLVSHQAELAELQTVLECVMKERIATVMRPRSKTPAQIE